MAFDRISASGREGGERGLGSDFDSVSREILLGLLDDLEDGKIDKPAFDAATGAVNDARGAGTRDEAIRILAGAAIDESISDERYKKMKAAIEAGDVGAGEPNVHGETREGEAPLGREVGPEQIEAVADAAVHALTGTPEDARALVEGAAPDLTPLERESIVGDITTKDGKQKLSAKIGGYLKHLASWEFVAAAGAGGVTRTATKAVILTSFGSTFGAGIAAGAVVGSAAGAIGGAFTGGVREYISERRKFVAGSILWQLGEGMQGKSGAERAAIVARADQAYRKGRISGNKEELETLADELRAAKLLVDSNIERLGNEGDEVNKIKAILATASDLKKLIPKTERKEAQKLIEEVIFARKKVDLQKVASSALKGAAVGAVGGAIGGALVDYFSGYFHSAAHIIGTKTGAASGATAAARTAAREELLAKKMEASAAAARKIAEKAQNEILHQKFGAIVERGDGATQVARKIVHDYLVNKRQLDFAASDSFERLTPEQMVYVEDALQKSLSKVAEKGFSIGDHFELSGEDVAKAVDKALNLNPEKLGHLGELLKEPGHRLSSKTIEAMTNLAEVRDSGNNFYVGVVREVREAAAKAAAQVREAIPPPQGAVGKVVEKGARAAAKNVIMKRVAQVIMGLTAGGIVGGGTLMGREMLRRRRQGKAERAGGTGHEEDAAIADWEGEGGVVPREADEESPIRWERPKIEEVVRRTGQETSDTRSRWSIGAHVTTGFEEPPRGPEGERTIETFEELQNHFWNGTGVIVDRGFYTNDFSPEAMKDTVRKIYYTINTFGSEKLRGIRIFVSPEQSHVSESGLMTLNVNDSTDALTGFLMENTDNARRLHNDNMTAQDEYNTFWRRFNEKGIILSNWGSSRKAATRLPEIEKAISGFEDGLRGKRVGLVDDGSGMFLNDESIIIDLTKSDSEIAAFLKDNLSPSLQGGAEAPQTTVTEPPPGLPLIEEVPPAGKTGAEESRPKGVFVAGLDVAEEELKDELVDGKITKDEYAIALEKIKEMRRKKGGEAAGATATGAPNVGDTESDKKGGENQPVFWAGLDAAKNDLDDQLIEGEITRDEYRIALQKIEDMRKKKMVEAGPRVAAEGSTPAGEAAEPPKNTQAIFDKLTGPYKKKGILISVADDADRSSIISMFPGVENMIKEIGPEKLHYTAINFFRRKYGVRQTMSVGTRKIKGVSYKVMNVDVDAPIESIKKFVEDNLG